MTTRRQTLISGFFFILCACASSRESPTTVAAAAPATPAPAPITAPKKSAIASAPTPAPIAKVTQTIKPVPVATSSKLKVPTPFSTLNPGDSLSALPTTPVFVKGCSLGCCDKLQNKILNTESDFYKEPKDSLSPVFSVPAGTPIKSASPHTLIRKYGESTVTKVPAKGLNADLTVNEQALTLRYLSDSKLLFWAKGKLRTLDEDGDSIALKTLKEASHDQWFWIELANGKSGWVLEADLTWEPCPESQN